MPCNNTIKLPPPNSVDLDDGTSNPDGSILVQLPFNENREECGEG